MLDYLPTVFSVLQAVFFVWCLRRERRGRRADQLELVLLTVSDAQWRTPADLHDRIYRVLRRSVTAEELAAAIDLLCRKDLLLLRTCGSECTVRRAACI